MISFELGVKVAFKQGINLSGKSIFTKGPTSYLVQFSSICKEFDW